MFLLDFKIDIINYCIRDLNNGYYASKIAKDLNLNQKSVSNYLNELEKENIFYSISEGRNKIFYFNFKNKSILFEFLLSFFSIKKINFLKKHFKIKEILEKLNLENSLIFGSFAKSLEKENSDLDILVIGNYDSVLIKKISDLYEIEINVKSFSKSNFIKLLKQKDIFIKEIVKDNVIISGYEFFLKNFIEYYYEK